MSRPKVAVCLYGSVARVDKRSRFVDELYTTSPYVNYTAVWRGYQEHVVNCNPDRDIDFFIHSWSQDLEDDLVRLYRPKKSHFEDNRIYRYDISSKILDNPELFSSVSRLLTMKKSIELMEAYQIETGSLYDQVILFRLDVLLWKDMPLDTYLPSTVYVNHWKWVSHLLGDFHFVMSTDNASRFKQIYEWTTSSNLIEAEGWFKKYIEDVMDVPFTHDDIIPALNQEVLRHIRMTSIDTHGVPRSILYPYGITDAELDRERVFYDTDKARNTETYRGSPSLH